MAFLQIENLTFTYPQAPAPAVRDLSMQIEAGEFVLLCGASGCGKTTLLRLLQKELAPFGETHGRITFDGETGIIGFVQQNPDAQIVTDKVWHELAFGLENLGVPTPMIRRRVAEMAGYFGIQDWYRRDTATLSGGQKQLLNLAAIMVMQPKLLILDEPTSQLDPIAASEFIATLYKLNRETGVTVLLSEHRLEEVFPKADKVAVMDGGALIAFDTPRIVGKRLSAHPIATGFPAAVRIFASLDGKGDCPLTVREGQAFLRAHYAQRAGARVDKTTPRPSGAPILSVEQVYFRYERESPDVLRGCDLQVYRGEVFSLLGGNGAGKSTLLNILAGLNRPYSGRVKIDGKRLKEYRSGALYRGLLGLLPQDPLTLFFKDTVTEDFASLLKTIGLSDEDQAARIAQITEQLHLADLLEKHPFDLSGGELQRCALAKLMLSDPKILLLDEPTKGLDASAKRELGKLLRTLAAQGKTVLMVTHDVEFAAAVSDRCALCFDGEILATDTPNAFFSQNYFYTTAAARISRGFFDGAVLCEEVVALCKGEPTV